MFQIASQIGVPEVSQPTVLRGGLEIMVDDIDARRPFQPSNRNIEGNAVQKLSKGSQFTKY